MVIYYNVNNSCNYGNQIVVNYFIYILKLLIYN
jgi:hypothetical protein